MTSVFKYPIHRSVNIDYRVLKKIKYEAMSIIDNVCEYKHYLVDGSVKVIPLISPGGKSYRLAGFSNGPSFKPTELLKFCPEIAGFLDSIPGKKHSCRISIMDKETEIYPHRDYFRSFEFGVVRLHLPLETDKKCIFNIDGKKFHLATNKLHFIDISKTHFVTNNGNKKRIHLIIDLEVTRELIDIFEFPTRLLKLSYLEKPHMVKTMALRPIEVFIESEYLPYPLSLSMNSWQIINHKNKWFFKSEKYCFHIIKNLNGSYSLDSVGPGFFFTLTEKFINLHCFGVTMLGEHGIYNGLKTCRIKL